jgi:curved DNA-binding protein CbpA
MTNYYAILHVLPSAEIDVIKAAYKALARKYHPDTFNGDKAYAGRRMQEINDAFAVIGDPEKRMKYDAERKKANEEDEFSANGDVDDAQLEADWVVACKYCPEATESFNHLNKLSRSLAFAFKSYLLDSKQFSECRTIRDKFRVQFLTNYFGLNPAIQKIGEKLVLAGELVAAKSVNRAVKVMGASLSETRLLQGLATDFPHLTISIYSTQQPSPLRQLFQEVTQGNPNLSLSQYDKLLRTLSIPFKLNSSNASYVISYGGHECIVSYKDISSWIAANLSDRIDK